MSVVLKELNLYNFRNHNSFSLKEPQRLIIIIGANATGKTNIIEAIQLVSMLESFKNPFWHEVVTNAGEKGGVEARFLQNERLLDVKMDIFEGKRSYSLNGKSKRKHDLKGLVPAVIFVPDDLTLVKDSPEVRRKLFDDIGQQLSPTYLTLLSDYQKTVRQRNIILKRQREEGRPPLPYPSVLNAWDENLVRLGTLLFIHRIRLYKRLVENAFESYSRLSEGEVLTSRYLPSFNRIGVDYSDEELIDMDKDTVEDIFKRTQEVVRDEEWARIKTLVGPHRDEIQFFIEGYDARRYGSQGQQRSVALALKLAQLSVVQKISGNQPLLLLDDVMSELDKKRRMALIEAIDGQVQTIITATDLSCFDDELLRNAQVIELQ
jgi:DNA replication and repair protein RecF